MFVLASLVVVLAGVGMMIDGNWDRGQLWVVFARHLRSVVLHGLLVIAPMAKRLPVKPAACGQELIRRIFTVIRSTSSTCTRSSSR